MRCTSFAGLSFLEDAVGHDESFIFVLGDEEVGHLRRMGGKHLALLCLVIEWPTALDVVFVDFYA